ncbi:MAG: Crp/Fnr family transcriptional regulator [Alphaproteobacteria bacterium]
MMNDGSGTSSDLGLLPSGAAKRLAVDQGASVFLSEDPTRGLFQVDKGRIRLVRHAADGRAVTLHVARDGETFAEASLFAERYHCDAIADLPSTVLQFDKALVLTHLAADPERAAHWIAHLSRQVQALRGQVAVLGLKSAGDRLLAFLRMQAGTGGTAVIDRPWKAIATELGLTHEVVYRTLAKLERERLILRDPDGRSIELRPDRSRRSS